MVYPLAEGTRQYLDVETSQELEIVRRPTERLRADWLNAEGDQRTQFWQVSDDGNILLTAVIDEAEHALTVFEPPLVAMYAELSPGQTREADASMRVVDSRQPKRVRETGRAVQSITYAGDCAIRRRLDGREVEHLARHLVIEFRADLRLADVHDRTDLYVVPDLGPVLETREQTLIVLGVLPKKSRRVLLLVRKHQ